MKFFATVSAVMSFALSAWISECNAEQAQVPVPFSLEKGGYVTLVIENQNGQRVANLVSDTYFEAGDHVVWWDGYNVGWRKDKDEYLDVEQDLVAPGTYTVRGLVHDDIELKYCVSVQSPGTPPWHSPDSRGAWLADHSPPSGALCLPEGSPYGDAPQMLLAAPVAEAGHGLIWVDLDGEKLFGKKIGWAGGTALASDSGQGRVQQALAYSVVLHGGVTLFELRRDGTQKQVLYVKPENAHDRQAGISLAVHDGIAVISLPNDNKLLLADVTSGKVLAEHSIQQPRGLLVTGAGNLLVVSGKSVLQCVVDWKTCKIAQTKAFLADDLQEPAQLAADLQGNVYVSDWGQSHQVKVYDQDGRLLRVIGKAGNGEQFGYYDEEKMHFPYGMDVDSRGMLWVAECSFAPKRVSVWNSKSGQFVRAFYGPPRYAGACSLDPRDKSRVYYPSQLQGIEFTVDWKTGESKPRSIYYLKDRIEGRCPMETVYIEDRQYMVNVFTGGGMMQDGDGGVYRYDQETGTVKLVAQVGRANKNRTEGTFAQAIQLVEDRQQSTCYAWSDLNLDGVPQRNEVKSLYFGPKRRNAGLIFGRRLDITLDHGVYIPPPTFTEQGVPVWDLTHARRMPYTTFAAHGNAFFAPEEKTYIAWQAVHNTQIFGFSESHLKPLGQDSQDRSRLLREQYLWKFVPAGGPGCPDPLPKYPGQIIRPLRTRGFPFTVRKGEAGEIFSLNGYKGNLYLITTDGLYLTDLGGDFRIKPVLGPPEAHPGMIIDDYSFAEEHYGPMVTQAEDGTVYLTAGKNSNNIFEVLNLDTVERLEPQQINVTETLLPGLPEKRILPGELREMNRTPELKVSYMTPQIDGELDDWEGAAWAPIADHVQAEAAIAADEKMLYVAWRTSTPALLDNSLSNGWQYAFATGGGLDLMIRTDPDAELKQPHRLATMGSYDTASPGDVRIFITRDSDPAKGRLCAVRYQQIGGKGGEKILYESPVGKVEFDTVQDVSQQVNMVQKGGNFEVAIPLSVVGVKFAPGEKTRGDFGILTGNGAETTGRFYWSNKASTMVSDIPTEARLFPHQWGIFEF